ncbi:DUF4168 domain-containing protein [Fodinibius sediminis]|uniref:DUF4168 domain-containing protein n=1 Tax=Fodinibius sediminis TaxID=1214077 RepID=A0A521ANN4_9BACT|nr:DUF4168 domain-containing protein [Fodinibius sediminis]SMO36436.1 protein of unknown function [Fodinibius sediminis]
MKCFKTMTALFLGLFFLTGTAIAQIQQPQAQQPAQADSISDAELKKFANVTTEAQEVQQQMRDQVDSMLAEKNMEMERFQQIMMSKRNPQMADSVEVTEKEQKTMKEIQPKLMQMQQKSQQQMVSIIQDNDLQPQRFQQIMQAVRTNPEVMKRFQELSGNGQN